MLDYFKEVPVSHPDGYKSEFILWNNKYIYFRDIFMSKEFVLFKVYKTKTENSCPLYKLNIMFT